jgi:uncharacterized cofD-like protein
VIDRLESGRPHSGLPQEIVVIGGGTGNSTVVRAFTQEPLTGAGITAIPSTFDDGGGTGELRRVYSELPAVGDIRQCLAAMSGLPDSVLGAFASRFDAGSESDRLNIEGQTLGNLVIAGIIKKKLDEGGSFSDALKDVGKLLQIKGNVVAPSDDIRTLVFDLPDGTRIFGEHNAEEAKIPSFKGAKISYLEGHEEDGPVESRIRPAKISNEAKDAIASADIVLLAPGDLYTSIAPNLAVEGMGKALKAAKVVMMISNLMNRDRHTVGFTTADYVREYERIIGEQVIERVIYNTAKLDPVALEEQRRKGSSPVRPAVGKMRDLGYVVRGFDLLSRKRVAVDPNDALSATRSEIRHDPGKLGTAIMSVYLNNGFAEKS